ncbi:MAG TPA: M20/M25/M40 family metallo-hydrolase [Gemmatimonadaceae bacterium]|nr:M20/M25/M40 family metallo-hydrolase [Gemmatimonadaceae bacterium]
MTVRPPRLVTSIAAVLLTAAACRAPMPAPPPPPSPAAASAPPAEPVDSAMNARIRREESTHSRVMAIATTLSDVYGARLAGSPQYLAAARWARATLDTFGLDSARLEPWGRRRGLSWEATRWSVEMTAPRYQRLVAYPKAWSPPIDSVVRGTPVLLSIRSDSDIARHGAELAGAIVMMDDPAPDPSRFEPLAHRFTAAELDSLSHLTDPGHPVDYWDDAEGYAERVAKRNQLAIALRAAGVAAVVERSRLPNAVQVAGYQAYDSDVSHAVPAFVMSQGDFDQVAHLIEHGVRATLELSLRTHATPGDSIGYNILAELPGSDSVLRNQVVMVGGHFDSWTAGTGATDNAAGVAVAMEAVRILKAIGASPRRTIRVALWDGEEQEDYFGSMGYVKKHFGDPETMHLLPEHSRISAYFNIDNGTGRIRGIYLQNDSAVRPIFAAWLAPFADLGANTLTIANTGSTDHMPFTAVGIPAFEFIQDPLDYETLTHHSNADVASNLVPGDLEQAAIVVASVLYHAANRDALLPRGVLPLPHRR